MEQNDGKFQRLKKIVRKKSRFVGINKFLKGTSLLDVYIRIREKKIVMGTLTSIIFTLQIPQSITTL